VWGREFLELARWSQNTLESWGQKHPVKSALTLCIAPATAARLLSARVTRVLFLAGSLGASAGLAGLLASYHLGLPAGPVVAVLAVAEVAAAVLARTCLRRRHAN
jgi:ABC-type Mn2+/Zn2+ transport system permease subunit